MAHEGYHEPTEELTDETRDMHRAIASLMEELEAVDWYQQRIDAARDPELKRILAHNRDEEKEHAAMVLEWLRRRDPFLDEQLRTYLFTQGEITTLEEAAMGRDGGTAEPASGDGSLGIGSLKNTKA
jgi:ferritin-like protein